MITPEKRSMRSRISAHRVHAAGKTNTAPARNAFMNRFEREVEPECALSPHERHKRAGHARKVYFTSLALKSTKARRKRAPVIVSVRLLASCTASSLASGSSS
jgi:hypothetical protein